MDDVMTMDELAELLQDWTPEALTVLEAIITRIQEIGGEEADLRIEATFARQAGKMH